MNTTLILMALLLTKHFVIDFPMQGPYQYKNKGTYGHAGGILHATLHGVGTYLCIMWYAPLAAIWLGLGDAVLHYHIDWAKMNLNKKMGWGPTIHEQFWWLLGLDQFLHGMTYIVIVSLVTL